MIIFLVGNQWKYLILNLSNYILLSYIAIKLSKYRTGIKFDKDPLAVEQNSYLSRSVYIVYDVDTTDNFKLKNCLFGAPNIVRNSNKGKYVYSRYRITLTVQVHGVLILTLIKMLYFLVLIIVHYLILTIARIGF